MLSCYTGAQANNPADQSQTASPLHGPTTQPWALPQLDREELGSGQELLQLAPGRRGYRLEPDRVDAAPAPTSGAAGCAEPSRHETAARRQDSGPMPGA